MWVKDAAGLSFILLSSSTGRVTQASKQNNIPPHWTTIFFDPLGTSQDKQVFLLQQKIQKYCHSRVGGCVTIRHPGQVK
jgi:hypothetical protein